MPSEVFEKREDMQC